MNELQPTTSWVPASPEDLVIFKPQARRTQKLAIDLSEMNLRDLPALEDFWESLTEYGSYHQEMLKGANNLATYKYGMKCFFDWIDRQQIQLLTEAAIREYRAWLLLNKKQNTARSYFGILKRFFEWTNRSRVLPNLAANVKNIKLDSAGKHTKNALTIQQTAKMLEGTEGESLSDLRDRAMIAVAASCALRRTELQELLIRDFRHNQQEEWIFKIRGKGHLDKNTEVIIPDPVAELISLYLKSRPFASRDEALFASCAPGHKGQPLNLQSISHILKGHIQTAVEEDRMHVTSHRPWQQLYQLAPIQQIQLLQLISRSDISGSRDAALIMTAAGTSLMPAELAKLNKEDLTEENGQILLPQKNRKGKILRQAAVPAGTWDIIQAYLNQRSGLSDDSPLFATHSKSSRKSRLSAQSIRRIFEKHLRELALDQNLGKDSEPLKENLARLSGHSLRHYAITQAVRAGHPITEVKDFARHGDISTTDRYIHEQHDAFRCSEDVSGVLFGMVKETG